MTQNCDSVDEYYDRNTGACSLCDEACNSIVWQTDICSTDCAGLYGLTYVDSRPIQEVKLSLGLPTGLPHSRLGSN